MPPSREAIDSKYELLRVVHEYSRHLRGLGRELIVIERSQRRNVNKAGYRNNPRSRQRARSGGASYVPSKRVRTMIAR